MEHTTLLYDAYAEFLALRLVEYQLMSSLEQHLEQMSLPSVKLLVKHQKTMNNAMVKTIAKVSRDLPKVVEKLKDMHPEVPTQSTPSKTMTSLDIVQVDVKQMHPEAPAQPTLSETMTSPDLVSFDEDQALKAMVDQYMHSEAPTQPTPSETMTSPDLMLVVEKQMHPEAPTQATPSETMTSPDFPEASTQSTPTETMTSPWLESMGEDLASQAMED